MAARSKRGRLLCALGLTGLVPVGFVVACSGSSGSGATAPATRGDTDSGAPVTTGDGDGGTTTPLIDGGTAVVSTQAGACPNPTLPIVFSPMYSAYIAGSNAHVFAVPAVMGDGSVATWSVSDPAQANLQAQAFPSGGVAVPGVLITVAGGGDDAGQITVVATAASGACGTSVLTLTANTDDDWTIGNARYNDGIAIHTAAPPGAGADGGAPRVIPDGGFAGFEAGLPRRADGGSYFESDGGTACTNCHGPTATSGPYKTVSHTPEQTGGFSDGDLANIILHGEVPDGGYFDPTVIDTRCDGGAACTAAAYQTWHQFHQWADISSDELPGVICYLRALAPESQDGTSNFGGRRPARGPVDAGHD